MVTTQHWMVAATVATPTQTEDAQSGNRKPAEAGLVLSVARAMATRKRLRRTAILCCHAIANLASYRAGWSGKRFRRENVSGNVRIAISWISQCWSGANSLSIAVAFTAIGTSLSIRTDSRRNSSLISKCRRRTLRPIARACAPTAISFVAHLDDDPKAKYPQLDVAMKSTKFLYNYLRRHEDQHGHLDGLPRNLEATYRLTLDEAKAALCERMSYLTPRRSARLR